MDLSCKSVHEVLRAVYHLTGFLLPSSLIGIVASPPCITFSNFDCQHKNHRDHTSPTKPAVSKMAKAHDAMVRLHFHYTLLPSCTHVVITTTDGHVHAWPSTICFNIARSKNSHNQSITHAVWGREHMHAGFDLVHISIAWHRQFLPRATQ